MPNLDTEAIEAELEAITRGEWRWRNSSDERLEVRGKRRGFVEECQPAVIAEIATDDDIDDIINDDFANFIFIAHAPIHVRNLLDRVQELETHVLQTNGLLLLAAMHKENVDGEYYLDAETKEECRKVSGHGQGLVGRPPNAIPTAQHRSQKSE